MRYAEDHPGDSCWSYNERATLSTFVGAAWRRNWFALEEFGTEKHRDERDAVSGEKLTGYGRCDLFLSNASTSYVIEAKQSWQRIGPRVRVTNGHLDQKIESAFNDIAKIQKFEANKRIALTFVAPSFPASLLRGMSERDSFLASTDIVETWLESLSSIRAVHASAWAFPHVARCLKNHDDSRVFPGVVALLRECKRAARVAR